MRGLLVRVDQIYGKWISPCEHKLVYALVGLYVVDKVSWQLLSSTSGSPSTR